MNILLITNEVKTIEGIGNKKEAAKFFGGTFQIIDITKKKLNEEGFDVVLFIVTSTQGIVNENKEIDYQGFDINKLKANRNNIINDFKEIISGSKYDVIIFMLSSIYAKLFLNDNYNSSAIKIIKKVYHQNSMPKIIILTSQKINRLFEQEAKIEKIYLKLYNRVGVVAIKNVQRKEIIDYLKSKIKTFEE